MQIDNVHYVVEILDTAGSVCRRDQQDSCGVVDDVVVNVIVCNVILCIYVCVSVARLWNLVFDWLVADADVAEHESYGCD